MRAPIIRYRECVVARLNLKVNIPALFQLRLHIKGWTEALLESRGAGWSSWTHSHTHTHTHAHTGLLLPHCIHSVSPSCRAQHGSRVCTAATLAWPRRMCPLLWSPRHQRHEPVCSTKHERHLALCPQPSLALMRAARERRSVCVCVCVCACVRACV